VAAAELTPRILPSAEHLIAYHILISGRCYGGLRGEEQVELGPGDAIVFPHGDANLMSSARNVRSAPDVNMSAPARYPDTLFLGDTGRPVTKFVCGFLGCDRRPYNPLLAALPRQMHVRGMADSWACAFSRQLIEESRGGLAGAECVLTRLAELMFIEVLRRYLRELPRAQTGWLAGLRDEVVGRALALIHNRPGHPWTLADIARAAATSRSSLSRRFTEFVGQSPMQYLNQWRMQVAANRLVESGDKVATIGAEVGYDSDAAFSRAFKKETGMAPGAWRDARRTPGPRLASADYLATV
jgi:AraC-like DNA-binding protein